MRADGYGADIELTETAVVIHSGKAAAKIQGTDTITVPYGDIASIEYRSANPFVNGQMKLVVNVADVSFGETLTAVRQGDDATDATSQRVREWSERYRSYGADPNNHVNPESLLVHWRRKDEAAFAAIRDAINARILR
jgi:hypothetical protein